MKRILFKIGLFFGAMVVPLAVLFFMPYSENFAFHYIKNDCYNHGSWILDRIKHNQAAADVVFIGSSHTIHAFQDRKIEEMLQSERRVVNLGYCRYGRDMEFAILKLLLQNKSPQLVIIEVHEVEEKSSHEIFPYVASSNDLLTAPFLYNGDYFSNIITGGLARLECFKSEHLFRRDYPNPQPELYGYAASNRIASETEMHENRMDWAKRLNNNQTNFGGNFRLSYPMTYLKKMTSELKIRNIPLVFVYLPESGSNLQFPVHAPIYSELAPLLIPPDSIFKPREHWMDASHLNDNGSELLSKWMAAEISRILCLEKTEQE